MLVTALWQDELQKVIALESQSVISDSSNESTFEGTDSDNISDPITTAQYLLLASILQTSTTTLALKTAAFTVL